MADIASLIPEAFSRAPTDASSNSASLLSDTPPTTVDSASLASEDNHHHHEHEHEHDHDHKSERVPLLLEHAAADGDDEASMALAAPTTDDNNSDSEQQSRPETPLAVAVDQPADPNATTTPSDSPSSSSTATRPRRARASLPVYNLSKLAGTDVHGKRRAKGDAISDRRRRTISGDTLVNQQEADEADEAARDSVESSIEVDGSTSSSSSPAAKAKAGKGNTTTAKKDKLVEDSINALDLGWSVNKLDTPRGAAAAGSRSPRRKGAAAGSASPAVAAAGASRNTIATRRSGAPAETLATKLSSLGKRGRKTFEKGITRMSRELRRLQDTNEFAHIDSKPVRHTVWSNGKYIDPDEEPEPPRKKVKTEEQQQQQHQQQQQPAPAAAEAEKAGAAPLLGGQRRVKTWLSKGLYAGQTLPADPVKGLSTAEKKAIGLIPELAKPAPANKALPFPVYNGLRTLITGREFKLPFDVCNPLPPGQPKPDEWRKMTRNRFIGEAKQYWIQNSDFKEYQSKCVCKPDDGCAETCQNRSMLYECDEHNCNIGRAHCTNRQFQDLSERTKKGGRYRVGVEVFKTADRGFGIRANRGFEPYQIIMEYSGEIITTEECENRMNEIYKDNKCYYLMSFDQNMIIDATTGSIARFVNHSCAPNCHMIKWIVSGQPRMALFAGSRPIQTGDELTYDYKFDPFSAKSVQACLCGADNCRGVLGPKRKAEAAAAAAADASVKAAVKATVKAGKRKLKELLGDGGGDDDDDAAEEKAAKKRKTKAPKAPSSSAAKTKAKTSSTAGGGIKRSLSSASLKAKGAATVIKRSVSTISVNARARLSGSSSAVRKAAGAGGSPKGKGGAGRTKTITTTKTTIRKSSSTSVLKKMYSSKGSIKGSPAAAKGKLAAARRSMEVTTTTSSSRNSSLTIVASNSNKAAAAVGDDAYDVPDDDDDELDSRKKKELKTASPLSTKSGRVVKRKSWEDGEVAMTSGSGSAASSPGGGGVQRRRSGIEIKRVEAQIRVVGEGE